MPGVTPTGYPYALPADPRVDWPATSQQLAEALQATPGGPIFASAAARDAAIPAPLEGMRCWRSDLNMGEIYSGTAWRGDYGTAGTGGRVGFGVKALALTTAADGQSQALDLSQGGIFTGNLLWIGGTRLGTTSTVQLAITSALVTACKVAVRSETGAVLGSQTVNIYAAFMAALPS